MNNFFGLGTADSFYDKRRHINVIFMEIVNYHFYADPSFADRMISLLKSGKSEADRASDICNYYLTYDEHNFLNLLRERYGLSDAEFITIMSGVGIMDRETRSPASYDAQKNKELLVQMVVATESMTHDFTSNAFTQITRMIGGMGKGMRGISFDQAKFNNLFDLTFKAMEIYKDSRYLREIEKYVIARW